MQPIIRTAEKVDLGKILELVLRLKRLNEEFDSLLHVRDDAAEKGRSYIESSLASERSLVLVAEDKGRIVGVMKADIRERTFYEPKIEGAIVDLYVLPEYRRSGLGARLIEETIKKLRGRVDIVTAEFPTQNMIAADFYRKLGFRAIISIHAKPLNHIDQITS